jgi:MerR family mercuric resistance operon transcriptional regulator
MRAGELAMAAGVHFETLRFYEREKVLPEPRRLSNGYRVFDERHVRALRFIHEARELGFSLDEIRSMVQLEATGSRCTEVASIAAKQLEDVRAKIRSLKTIARRLEKLVES